MRWQLIYGSYLAFKGLYMPVLVPSSSSLIVFFFFAYSTVEYVDPRVLFSTLKWPFTYSKKRGFHFFPFIQVLNFWVPERARLILHVNYCWRTQLWVHKASGFKGYVLDLKNIFFSVNFSISLGAGMKELSESFTISQ